MNPSTELPILATEDAAFTCPGESRPISRSLHLARLANGHRGCRTCIHREETGLLPKQVVARTVSRLKRQSHSLFTPDGLRGLYVNQLTREVMSQIVQHVLEIADETRVLNAPGQVRGGLRVVTGYDSRPSSPDLAIGMVSMMKQCGCTIADLGLITRPAFDDAIERLRPHVGIYLTGGNSPNAWSGLDLVDENGLPWCSPGLLAQLEQKLDETGNRTSRADGCYEAINLQGDYEARLADQFHAIRPFRLTVSSIDPLQRGLLRQLLDQTPCSVHYMNGGLSTADGTQRACRSMVDILCDRRLDFGVYLGADGRSFRLFDEGGFELKTAEVLALLSQIEIQDAEEILRQTSGMHQADLIRHQRTLKIPVVADAASRYWLFDGTPACDAIQTLAKLLEILSLNDRPVSAYRSPRPGERGSRR
ncbi:hypothetical protein SH661x_003249 [Planctomicrobium sp. SH661]|uniref:hypothetical protein n=1 Tax=Planctomicrobium sp. SH661 TaxID=3448124 RepID=UPI003F5B95EA